MSSYDPQRVEEQFEKLPDALREAMFSDKIANIMFSVGEQFALNVEQIGILATESGYVVLGLTPPPRFVAALQEALSVDETKAQSIAHEINKQVFQPLRETLKKTHEIEVSDDIFKKPETPRPPTTRPVPPPIPPKKPPAPVAPGLSVPPPRPPVPAIPPAAPPRPQPPTMPPAPQEETRPTPMERPVPPKNQLDLRAGQKTPLPPTPPSLPKPPTPAVATARDAPPVAPVPPQPPPAPSPQKEIPTYGGMDPYREPVD